MNNASNRSLAGPLADPDTFQDGAPWQLYRQLRDDDPVAWTPEDAPHSGFWSVTRHADIVRVSRDWETFTSSRGVSLEELDDDQLMVRRSMIDTDPPRHGGLRKVAASAFFPRVVNGYEAFLRGVVASTLDAALQSPNFDFVKEVSSEIPVRVLCRLLAVPDDDRELLTGWGDRLVGHTDPELADVLLGSEESEQYRLVPFRRRGEGRGETARGGREEGGGERGGRGGGRGPGATCGGRDAAESGRRRGQGGRRARRAGSAPTARSRARERRPAHREGGPLCWVTCRLSCGDAGRTGGAARHG